MDERLKLLMNIVSHIRDAQRETGGKTGYKRLFLENEKVDILLEVLLKEVDKIISYTAREGE